MTGGPFIPKDEYGPSPSQHRTANEESGQTRAAPKPNDLSTTIFRATESEESGGVEAEASVNESTGNYVRGPAWGSDRFRQEGPEPLSGREARL